MPKEDLFCTNSLFDSIVEEYAEVVTRICYLRLTNCSDAEDCWQNVFIKLYHSPKILNRPHEEIRKWLITVTLNECKDSNRKLFHRSHSNIDELILPYNEDFDKRVLHAVKELPRKYSQVIYLHYYEGYSVKEMADILKIKENTVKSQLMRGRELLKGGLDDG